MKRTVLILGADGLLGRDLISYFSNLSEFLVEGAGRSQLDITKYLSLEKKIDLVSPDFVINCAAYTNVDRAEFEKDKCQKINVEGAANVARAVLKAGANLIHISTASVFESQSDNLIKSNSDYSPANFYSETKVAAEQICQEILQPRELLTIMRTYWLYGFSKPSFTTFVANNLLKNESIKVVKSQHGQPSSTRLVFEAVLHRIAGRVPNGIYPATNSGQTSRVAWAQSVAQILGKPLHLIETVEAAYFGIQAKRPYNTSLDHSAWEKHGIHLSNWKNELNMFIREEFPE